MEQTDHVKQTDRTQEVEQVGEKTVKARTSRIKRTAFITELCTGCGGSPICVIYCKSNALSLVEDRENYPFKIMQVDATRCTGCGACVSRGTMGMLTTGCPWNAIVLLPAKEGRTIH